MESFCAPEVPLRSHRLGQDICKSYQKFVSIIYSLKKQKISKLNSKGNKPEQTFQQRQHTYG